MMRSATAWAASGIVPGLDQHRELVATEAGHGVTRSSGRTYALRHLDQQSSPAGMTKTVVHDLEVVEVQEQHRDRVVLALALSIACESRSKNSARLAKPVSVSWKAW
jgi:hypothetical protein